VNASCNKKLFERLIDFTVFVWYFLLFLYAVLLLFKNVCDLTNQWKTTHENASSKRIAIVSVHLADFVFL
jgi:hypothetical protein